MPPSVPGHVLGSWDTLLYRDPKPSRSSGRDRQTRPAPGCLIVLHAYLTDHHAQCNGQVLFQTRSRGGTTFYMPCHARRVDSRRARWRQRKALFVAYGAVLGRHKHVGRKRGGALAVTTHMGEGGPCVCVSIGCHMATWASLPLGHRYCGCGVAVAATPLAVAGKGMEYRGAIRQRHSRPLCAISIARTGGDCVSGRSACPWCMRYRWDVG